MTCATNTDDCAAAPCLNGATCVDGLASFTCQCPAGYEGEVCTDVDECAAGIDDCDDNATCSNNSGGWACDCDDGFVGDGTSCSVANEPPKIFLTISRLPDYLNGSIPYSDGGNGTVPFYVRTARDRTCLDVRQQDDSGPVDWTTLTLVCDRTYVTEEGLVMDAGAVLQMDDFTQQDQDGWRSLCVALDTGLEETDVHCIAEAEGEELSERRA